MTANRTAVALVGFGSMARLGPLPALTEDPTFELNSIVEPDLEARAQAAELAPGASVYPSLAELFRNAQPDLVIVASPTQLHASALEELASYGASVLCEKPLVTQRRALERTAERWRGREDSLKVVHNYAYSASRVHARAELLSGRIGEWQGATVDVSLSASSFVARSSWRSLPESGGPLLDVGYHYLYLAEFLTGRPLVHVSRVRETAQRQELVATHAGGGATRINLALSEDRGSSTIQLVGSQGTLELVGARKLNVHGTGRPTSQSFAASFSDGYGEMLRDTRARRPRDDSWRGHFHEAARLLELLFDALEAATAPHDDTPPRTKMEAT